MPSRPPIKQIQSKDNDNRPALRWEDGKLPVSERFNDSYYSAPRDGLDGRYETREVFIRGNALPERWKNPEYRHDRKTFHIAELGFGTGLNFLETALQWQNIAPQDATLHYTAFEQYPLSEDQLKDALAPWPDLLQLAQETFLSTTPHLPDSKTLHYMNPPDKKFTLAGNRAIILTLAIGDANVLLPQWHQHNKNTVDAWYLDGFSPAKNPQLWNPSLMQQVFGLTAPEGTFSTYTSAGHVRRALSAAGFLVHKVKGFGRKRHRLEGIKLATSPSTAC